MIMSIEIQVKYMTIDRKLMRNGNGWALSINSTILGLLDINPETDMVRYNIENKKLIIEKSDKQITPKE